MEVVGPVDNLNESEHQTTLHFVDTWPKCRFTNAGHTLSKFQAVPDEPAKVFLLAPSHHSLADSFLPGSINFQSNASCSLDILTGTI